MDALQRHTRGVLCDLKTADIYLAKYLGPQHPIRKELGEFINELERHSMGNTQPSE